MADLVQNDTASSLQITCTDQTGAPIDLTGCTVNLEFFIDSYPPVFTRTMTISDAKNGVVTYKFGTFVDTLGVTQFDLGTPGVLYYRTVITFIDQTILSSVTDGNITIHPLLA